MACRDASQKGGHWKADTCMGFVTAMLQAVKVLLFASDKGKSSIFQAVREDMAKQKHAWASARRTLQAQQSSLQDECNDLACQLAERDQKLRTKDERIGQLKKLLEDANMAVASRRNSEVMTS